MRSLNSWRKDHLLGTDIAISLLILLILYGLIHYTPLGHNVKEYFDFNRMIMYRTTATISGSLMGFSITITVLAINLWRTKWFPLLKEDLAVTKQIWTIMRQTTWCLAMLTVLCLALMMVKEDSTIVVWAMTVYFGLLLITLVRLFRAIRVIHQMAGIVVSASRQKGD